ncbi:MAG: hypothetical protein JRG91_02725 [Deltaproteobacteria bacterium]|nr:hypothetical protein [Deltaproteobacteria bacterium]
MIGILENSPGGRGHSIRVLGLLVALGSWTGGCAGDEGCPVPMFECGGECRDVTSDSENCGGCALACGPGYVCEDASCTLSCLDGYTVCTDVCRDLSVDFYNCGMCGLVCSAGNVCLEGSCQPDCPDGYSACSGTCKNLVNDPSNCGECGNVCADGEVCLSGACSFTCPSPYVDCSGSCADLQIDHRNCGACGTACAPGQVCEASACVNSCIEGLTMCSGACSDLMRDPENCGSCASRCGTGENCYEGTCIAACPGGFSDCSGTCRDLDSDRLNCGACETECLEGELCVSGACEVTCASPLVECSGVCSDRDSDPHNCGTCGTRCGMSEGCVSGSCVGITCLLVEDFEAGGSWPLSPWVAHASGGTLTTTAAHDGTYGLEDAGWSYRTDVSTGSGARLTWWVHTDTSSSGRVYLGFDSSSTGCKSFVVAPNTTEIMFMNNSSWSFSTFARVTQSFSADHWYLAEVTIAGSVATGRLYDSDGSTLINTTTYDYGSVGTGGVAIRSFGGIGVDTITLCP